MKSIKVCEYSRSRSFHDDLILQDQASGERSHDQWSSGLFRCLNFGYHLGNCVLNGGTKVFCGPESQHVCICIKKIKNFNDGTPTQHKLVAILFEPRREKTGLRGFRPAPTKTGLYSHRKNRLLLTS